MRRNRRIRSKKFMIVIISKERRKVDFVIEKTNYKLEITYKQDNDLYKAVCYGERDNRSYQIIKPTYVPNDTWVYEFHDRDGFIYNHFEYKNLNRIDLPTVVDVLYRTGPLSLDQAMKTVLKKRIFSLDQDSISILLEIENSQLFESIVLKLIKEYTKQDLFTFINLDYIGKLQVQIDYMLKDIGKYYQLFHSLSHLIYDQFLDLVSVNE